MTDPTDKLAALSREYWEGSLEADPAQATILGDHRYDDRLADISPAGIAREDARVDAIRARLRGIDPASLSPGDRVTYRALDEELQRYQQGRSCALHEWTVSSRSGPHLGFMNLAELTPVKTLEDGRHMTARWALMGPYMDQEIANLRRGLADGRVAPRRSIDLTVAQLDDILGQPTADWVLCKPAKAPHDDWSAADLDAFRKELARITEDSIRPAFARYRDFLAGELAPGARGDDRPGIVHLKGGAACYEKLIESYTTLPLSADEVHRFGLEEVARLRRELETLGQKTLGTSDIPEIQRRLRTDPALHFRTREEVEAKADHALSAARAAIPRWFGRLPKAPCEVIRVPEYEEKDTTIAYYREASTDGSRPGYYYINTYAPETRPRYEAEVLAYHESIPGHHLQISIAQEIQGLPEFRKFSGSTAFVEGWALYTERLAGEMGLYTDDVDRLGVLSFDLWRACRLVVDTGIHAKGWSRQRAIDYMVANTLLAENNVENEVDRYINWPGQALAYKIGQREILRLRGEAEEKLGTAFDIRRFHDVVLENGALSLPSLRAVVEDWIASGGK